MVHDLILKLVQFYACQQLCPIPTFELEVRGQEIWVIATPEMSKSEGIENV